MAGSEPIRGLRQYFRRSGGKITGNRKRIDAFRRMTAGAGAKSVAAYQEDYWEKFRFLTIRLLSAWRVIPRREAAIPWLLLARRRASEIR